MAKLRTYEKLKQNFCAESYINHLAPRFRSVIAKMRCGVFPLALETGRWRGLPIDNRTCPYCHDAVESEMHFLVERPLYQALREKYLNSEIPFNWTDLTDREKLYILLNDLYKSTAIFIREAFSVRNNL